MRSSYARTTGTAGHGRIICQLAEPVGFIVHFDHFSAAKDGRRITAAHYYGKTEALP